MNRSESLRSFAAYTVIGVICVAVAFPLIWMVLSSFKSAQELFTSPPQLIPTDPTLQWYVSVLFGSSAPTYLTNSLIVGLCTTVICTILGTLAAYGVTRFQFPGKNLLLGLGLLAYVVPTIMLFVPVYVTLSTFGMVDTKAGLVVCHTIVSFPLALWMLRAFFDGIPRELDEFAWIDGASFFKTFSLVILPLASTGIFSVAVFVFVMSWNEYLFASVVATSLRNKTVPVGIAEYVTSYDVRWGDIMAMATLTTLPVIALFQLIQRYFVRGVLAGAVKG